MPVPKAKRRAYFKAWHKTHPWYARAQKQAWRKDHPHRREQDFQDLYCWLKGMPLMRSRDHGVDYTNQSVEYEFVVGAVCELKDVWSYPTLAAQRKHSYKIVFDREPKAWVMVGLSTLGIDFEIFNPSSEMIAKFRIAQNELRSIL